MALRDGRDQAGRTLEAAAEDDSDDGRRAQTGERVEVGEALRSAKPPIAEPPPRRPVMGGEGEGVGIAEQVEDERDEAGASRRLRQGAPRLRRDEDGAMIAAQPATSTARV